MARKSRQVVDYFPHMVKHGRSLRIIETHYKNDGYSLWFKLLEYIGASDGHVFDCKNIDNFEDLLAYAHLTEEKFNEIMAKFARLGMIDRDLWEKCRMAWSDNFVTGLGDVYEKRICGRPKKPLITQENIISGAEILISGAEIPQEGDFRGSYPQRNLTELKGTELNVTFSPVDNSGGDVIDPAKMTPLQVWESDQLSKAEKAERLAVPDCPKCKGTGFETFKPEEGSGIRPLKVPCGCWNNPDKYK